MPRAHQLESGQPSHPTWWRSLQERHGLQNWQRGEFAPGADLTPDGISRREFLTLAAAGMALAGMAGCGSHPAPLIVPAVRQPPELTPGLARFYASSLFRDGYANGIVVETHEGRPTKIEGNPDHPASLGASSAFDQAAVLELYDPERAAGAQLDGEPRSWGEARSALTSAASAAGAGLHLLLEPSSSPSLATQLAALHARLPMSRVHWHGTSDHAAELDATDLLFGLPLVAQADFSAVTVGMILGGDPLTQGPWSLRLAHDWAQLRRAAHGAQSRWYVAESSPSCSGFSADHRLIVEERDIARFAAVLLAELARLRSYALPDPLVRQLAGISRVGLPEHQVRLIAEDLHRSGSHAAVWAGPQQDSTVHAMVIAMNALLGTEAIGYHRAALIGGERDGISELIRSLNAGEVANLVVIGANPSYSVPASLGWHAAVERAGRRFRVGLWQDETAADCEWFIPLVHSLEAWGDGRAFDGTLSLQQPVIEPLYGGRSLAAILDALLGEPEVGEYQRLCQAWAARGIMAQEFTEALQRGCVPGSACATVHPTLRWGQLESVVAELSEQTLAASGRLDCRLCLDAKVYDGCYASNPWLQELPDPITKLTWDNALWIAPDLALTLGVEHGHVVRVSVDGNAIEVPVLVQPGQAPETVSLALGYGRRAGGAIANGVGVDAYPLRDPRRPWRLDGVQIQALGREHGLAVTQEHWALEDRPIALSQDGGKNTAHLIHEQNLPRPSQRTSAPASSPQWGMVVDLGSCTGCSACVTACQAENNVPVVGRDEVRRRREMHWLRVDRYYRGTAQAPQAIAQPMMCQHCEHAPCEYVCPTFATTHSPDGINEMTYNRCVGTRFCSNNCPYKVRRFNWFNYHRDDAAVTTLQRNPDVTVRARGVMEKCTYCVQRVRESDIACSLAGKERGSLPVVTACQQACPTQAITFGNILDAHSSVAIARASPRAYAVLADSGSQPRTRYLARITNPHPDWS